MDSTNEGKVDAAGEVTVVPDSADEDDNDPGEDVDTAEKVPNVPDSADGGDIDPRERMMTMTDIIVKNGLLDTPLPSELNKQGCTTWLKHLSSLTDYAAKEATVELKRTNKTTASRDLKDTVVERYIMNSCFLKDNWKRKLREKTRLAFRHLVARKLRRLRDRAKTVDSTISTVSADHNDSRGRETPDAGRDSPEINSQSPTNNEQPLATSNEAADPIDVDDPSHTNGEQVETPFVEPEFSTLFVNDTPTPERSLEEPFKASRSMDAALSKPVKVDEELSASVLPSIESSCSHDPAALAAERPVPIAPMTCAEIPKTAHVKTQLLTPLTTPSPVQPKAAAILKPKTPVTPQSRAHIAAASNMFSTVKGDFTTSPSAHLSSNLAATHMSPTNMFNSSKMSTFSPKDKHSIERPKLTDNNHLNEAVSSLVTKKRAREENIPDSLGEHQAKQIKRDDKLNPKHIPVALNNSSDPGEPSSEWLCLVQRASERGTVQTDTAEALSFDKIPTFDEILEKIQAISAYENLTAHSALFGDVKTERRIILALNSQANVKMWATRAAYVSHESPGYEGTIFVVDEPREGVNYKLEISDF
jgi:hypothetical protein